MAPAQVGQRLELRLDLLEPARLRLERGQERLQVGRGLAQLQLRLPERVAGRGELGREPLERCDRPLGGADEVARAVSVLG